LTGYFPQFFEFRKVCGELNVIFFKLAQAIAY
jgi:hypothetical protein